MGEERVALEDIPEPPLLRRHVDAALAVEEHGAVDDDAALVGTHEAGQALQRERLPGARGAEQRDDPFPDLPARVEDEPGQRLPDTK